MPIYPNYIVPINGQSVVKERTTQIFSAKTTSGSCNCDLEALKAELKEYTDEKIEAVNESLNNLDNKIETLSNSISEVGEGLNARIDNIQELYTKLDTNVKSLNTELTSLEARVETIEDTLDSLEKTVEKDVTIKADLWIDNEVSIGVEGALSTKKIDWGLPCPTTRENADAIGNAKIIITGFDMGIVTFSAAEAPKEDVIVSLKIRG